MRGSFIEDTQATVKMDNWLVEHCIVCVEFFVKIELVIQM
jgi:hypothetical protein